MMSKDSYHLSHDDLARPVLVKKSFRAKRMTLRVSPTRRDVILTIPRHTGSRRAGAFIEQHIDWLNRQIDDLPSPVPFVNGAIIPYEGEPHRLVFCGPRQKDQRGQGVVTRQVINGVKKKRCETEVATLHILGAVEHAPRRLTDWLKKQAKQKITKQVDYHAGHLGLSYARLGIRDQTSRWGSCSSNKALSFSWRLIFAPPLVLGYVAAHEVAHLREMNHSACFWKLVARTMPEHDKARNWLRNNGQDLHRYGASE
jgi:predicted metal-dependent hydrolase